MGGLCLLVDLHHEGSALQPAQQAWFSDKGQIFELYSFVANFYLFSFKNPSFHKLCSMPIIPKYYRDKKYTSHKKICATQSCTNSRFVWDWSNLYKKNAWSWQEYLFHVTTNGQLMEGQDLNMWFEAQWEASKNYMGRGQQTKNNGRSSLKTRWPEHF